MSLNGSVIYAKYSKYLQYPSLHLYKWDNFYGPHQNRATCIRTVVVNRPKSADGLTRWKSSTCPFAKDFFCKPPTLFGFSGVRNSYFYPWPLQRLFSRHPLYPSGNKTCTNFYSGVICQSPCGSRKIVIIGIKSCPHMVIGYRFFLLPIGLLDFVPCSWAYLTPSLIRRASISFSNWTINAKIKSSKNAVKWKQCPLISFSKITRIKLLAANVVILKVLRIYNIFIFSHF